MSELSVRAFYDDLADDYHPMFRDWDASMAYQAEVLDGLLSRCLGEGPHTVLDCSCGIGTQAIGPAQAGHRVVGSDLSPNAAVRAAAAGTTNPCSRRERLLGRGEQPGGRREDRGAQHGARAGDEHSRNGAPAFGR